MNIQGNTLEIAKGIPPTNRYIKKKVNLENYAKNNKFLYEKFEAKEVIGVSLKKTSVGKTEVFNKPGAKRFQFKLTGTRLRRGNFFDSKDVYLEYDKGIIQFRSFSSRPQGWQGEVKGKEAVAGKVSQGPLNEIIFRTLPNKNPDVARVRIYCINVGSITSYSGHICSNT